ncbi:hypothetical protein [Nocardia camponoti]|uniref:Uncharacterized protein n=1 Tax=Nocardia camponoti TaxID=1616106 RepID=A0A917VCR5_9NOCA|nr:hypothetical protein [Nocardia camponoti]GGK63281.1 hypothetical protein GCM10011591_39450 [Nocardia camponoti]
MAEIIGVNPKKLRQLGAAEGASFVLVTNPEFSEFVRIVEEGDYGQYLTKTYSGGDFAAFLAAEVPEHAHVLVMAPGLFFQSPRQEDIGPRRKLIAMACNSTPTDFSSLEHFMQCIEATDPDAQEDFAQRFFEAAENGDHLEYRDARYGTVAILRHFDQELVWNQQAGRVDWGEQQIVPAGEISVLPIEIIEFDEDLHLPLDGEIVIQGFPILHNGTPSYTRRDQARIHEQLMGLTESAVKATVTNGVMTHLEALGPAATPVVDMLESMFATDSRYRVIWEIGHAVNTTHELLAGNHAMNEVYGGTDGCLHWGIGLTPFTQYHLDIISPGTTVMNNKGEMLLGVAGAIAPVRLKPAIPSY